MKYFSIKRDNTYPCFCLGCLVGKKQSEMSQKDARYCLECQPIIQYEYSLLVDKGSWKRYKPVNPEEKLTAYEPLDLAEDTHKGKTKMLTLNENTAIVNNFIPRGRQKTYRKQELPVGFIKQLFREGNGLKAIASRLKREKDIKVSHMTIGRVLSGERTA